MTETVSLKHWRFLSFLTAQFLGAFNDNALKLVVSMASLSLILDPIKQQSYLAMTSALAILPFLLFSGYAGYLADRYRKGNVLRVSKSAEIFAMLAVLIIFLTGQNVTHLLVTLFLLATHSAFFSPSKYSILPEILSAEDLPKANGYLNMLTFVAIILGSLSGATLWGTLKHTPEAIGYILTAIAVLGTVLCLFVPNGHTGNAAKKFTLNPFAEIARGVSFIRQQRLLLACVIGSATFWMLGGLIYLSLILLGKTQLGLSESAAGSLFAFLASGIAVGSVIAGYSMGKTDRQSLIVIGAALLTAGCFLAGIYATSYTSTAILVSLIGLGGGLFVVPIVTLMQKHSPDAARGQILATSGFFDMLGVFLASALFWALGTQLNLPPASVIMAAGFISLVGLVVIAIAAPTLMLQVKASLRHPFRNPEGMTLGQRFIDQNKQHPFAQRMSDTTGQTLSGLRSLAGARLMARWLKKRLGTEQQVAVLLPASAGAALANIALALLGKISVNLNFSLGQSLMENAITKVGVTRIITTRKVVQKIGLAEDERMIFLDDMAASTLQRFVTAAQALLTPTAILRHAWISGNQLPNETATILFSSGSTAAPKAIMLSHQQIIANIDSVHQLLVQEETRQKATYAMAGTLPFFHSFGLTACLWLPAITGRRVAYHSNPLEAKTVVKMIAKEQLHILISTPTFVSHYVAAAKEQALDSLRLVILGGEKLTDSMEASLASALPNAAILQGYGCTELGPVVGINVPEGGYRKGSVGQPIPGVKVDIRDLETGASLPANGEGAILVKSPSRMRGYFGEPEMTAEVFDGDYYITGDIGHLDADGFLYVTDRLSRFSKIGGEMVPHGKIEAALSAVLPENTTSIVVAVMDAHGETLCILTTEQSMKRDEISRQLKQHGLPNLWVPRPENIFYVDELPLLPTGKRDLSGSKKLAKELMKKAA